LPTPNSQELVPDATSEAVGAPEAALLPAVAPIAEEPSPLLVLTPAKLMTVIDETTFCDSVALTETLARGAAANARHISDVPL
jgi:hypothetical protein